MPLWVYDSSRSENVIFSHGIFITLNIEPEIATLNGVPFYLKDLKARSDFYAVSRFVFPFHKPWDKPDAIIAPTSGFNVLGFTEQTSLKSVEVASIFRQVYPIQLIFAPDTEDFMDAIWLVTVDSSCGFYCNIKAEDILSPEINATKGFNRKLYTPRPVVEGPTTIKPNETVSLKFEYRNYRSIFKPCNFKSYIKCDAGYLPKTVVDVKDGYTNVNVTALGLEPGDTMTVKFGIDKVYTNAVQHTLTVI